MTKKFCDMTKGEKFTKFVKATFLSIATVGIHSAYAHFCDVMERRERTMEIRNGLFDVRELLQKLTTSDDTRNSRESEPPDS